MAFKIAKSPDEYLEFVNKYHTDTVAQKKVRRNEDGTPTTAMATGIEVDGYIATVPAYNRDTGQVITDRAKLKEMFEPKIRSGEIAVVPVKFSGARDKHPANLWPQLNKQKNAQLYDPAKALKAVKYDFVKKLGDVPLK